MAKVMTGLAVVVTALALASTALAGTGGALKGYAGQGASVQNQVSSGIQGKSGVKGRVVSRTAPAASSRAIPTKATAAKATPQTQGAATIGKLPFTGQDLGLLVAGGMLLLVVGAGFRRLSRDNA